MEKPTVLIVEDNDLNALILADLLELNGYMPLIANDGSQAITIIESSQPDLIVLDIQLPKISGLDILRWLKNDEKLRDIPVVAVTAFAMPSEEQYVRATGCNDYLSKPIATRAFLRVVGEHLGHLGHATA